jgi:hypothetical protein
MHAVLGREAIFGGESYKEEEKAGGNRNTCKRSRPDTYARKT